MPFRKRYLQITPLLTTQTLTIHVEFYYIIDHFPIGEQADAYHFESMFYHKLSNLSVGRTYK